MQLDSFHCRTTTRFLINSHPLSLVSLECQHAVLYGVQTRSALQSLGHKCSKMPRRMPWPGPLWPSDHRDSLYGLPESYLGSGGCGVSHR